MSLLFCWQICGCWRAIDAVGLLDVLGITETAETVLKSVDATNSLQALGV